MPPSHSSTVHENGKYLNRILSLKKQIVKDPPIYKQVIQGNDDKYGRRITAAIPNLRGVVRFEWTHAVNKTGENVTSGSTVTIWVRDILDNKKVDSTSVTYDFTEPQFSKMTFLRNEISNIPFSSGLELTVQDLESGIEHAEVKVTQMNDCHVMTNKTLTVPSVSMYACLNKPSSCYCPKALNVCYKRVYKLYISNCWLMVAKEDLESARVKLEMDVVNRAGLKTSIPRVHVNKTYSPEEDIYLYGGITFTTKQPWYISKDQLSQTEEIQTGRFARIFKAAYKTGRKSREVAAKALKDSPNEENSLLMIAKINFAATKVGEHRNVLKFVGAVVDNDALGPVLVLEYCENGPMDKWLTSRRDKVKLDILEQIQRFALGVVRGMAYLTGKGMVHRKLAARNCLLTFTNEVKVGGFGPCRMEDASADEDSKGDRIPVKWTAPECLQSLKGANEKSDIWSFGITMWEIFSMGKTPYTDMRSRDLPADLRNGHRLARPDYAEDIHYSMMQRCWEQKPEDRTTFADALGKLEASFGLRPTSGVLYYYSK